jgi:uncharacterized protein (TIGR02646 family)
MTFDVYGREDVKEALNLLFGGKCAYCEFDYSPGMPVDVEHFRPKGGVVDGSGSLRFPGYWWLASTWSNLLPSCIDCNRARWHKVGDDEHKFGKENLFPLPAGAIPARVPTELAAETPLLINPAEEDPADHLRFELTKTPGGRFESVVMPRRSCDGVEDPRGRASMETYGLNRPPLAQSRLKHLRLLQLALDGVEARFELADREPDVSRKAVLMKSARASLRNTIRLYTHWRCQYSAACRAYFRQWRTAFDARRAAPGRAVATALALP